MYYLIKDNVGALTECDLDIAAAILDQGTSNVAAQKLLRQDYERLYFERNIEPGKFAVFVEKNN